MSEFSSKDLEILSLKLDQVHTKQTETSDKVSDIRERVLNPETGLYPKVFSAVTKAEAALGHINGVKKDIDKLVGACSTLTSRAIEFESWRTDHEERNKTLEEHLAKITENMQSLSDDYKVRKSWKKWTDKIWVAVILFCVTGALVSFKGFFFGS